MLKQRQTDPAAGSYERSKTFQDHNPRLASSSLGLQLVSVRNTYLPNTNCALPNLLAEQQEICCPKWLMVPNIGLSRRTRKAGIEERNGKKFIVFDNWKGQNRNSFCATVPCARGPKMFQVAVWSSDKPCQSKPSSPATYSSCSSECSGQSEQVKGLKTCAAKLGLTSAWELTVHTFSETQTETFHRRLILLCLIRIAQIKKND